MDFVTDFPKRSKSNFSAILILVFHLTKMTHFVPCHKEIIAEESIDLFIDNCFKLHGIPEVIVSDKDPRFVGKIWQLFMRKLNTKLNMSTTRHPRTDGLPNVLTKQCKSCCVVIQLSMDLIWFLI